MTAAMVMRSVHEDYCGRGITNTARTALTVACPDVCRIVSALEPWLGAPGGDAKSVAIRVRQVAFSSSQAIFIDGRLELR
jgi:hypothetical protein